MHIPDGLIAPPVYLTAAACAVPAWAFAIRSVVRDLDERSIPRMAVITALAFVLSSIMVPLPGGAAAHFTGVGLLVVLFGLWSAFVACSAVLALQALLLGAGGITTLPITALSLGLFGGGTIAALHAALGSKRTATAVVVPVAVGVIVAATLVALVLGAQPMFGTDADGQPLYFPFGPAVTLPAVVLPHLALGVAEGVLTWIALAAFRRPSGAPA
jgi:cobalt/nickel transport system permease protein